MHTQLQHRPTDRAVAAIATPLGRGVRVLLGLILIATGLAFMPQPLGLIVAMVGLVPVAAGFLNWCLVGPLLGAPLRGGAARRQLGR
jgi:hypothetical protein